MFVWVKRNPHKRRQLFPSTSSAQIWQAYHKGCISKILVHLAQHQPIMSFASGALFITIWYIVLLFDCLTGPWKVCILWIVLLPCKGQDIGEAQADALYDQLWNNGFCAGFHHFQNLLHFHHIIQWPPVCLLITRLCYRYLSLTYSYL